MLSTHKTSIRLSMLPRMSFSLCTLLIPLVSQAMSSTLVAQQETQRIEIRSSHREELINQIKICKTELYKKSLLGKAHYLLKITTDPAVGVNTQITIPENILAQEREERSNQYVFMRKDGNFFYHQDNGKRERKDEYTEVSVIGLHTFSRIQMIQVQKTRIPFLGKMEEDTVLCIFERP